MQGSQAWNSIFRPGSVFRVPPTDVSAPLSPNGYVFPVYGQSSFTDTFRALFVALEDWVVRGTEPA